MIRKKILPFCLAVVLGCAASVGHTNMNSTATEALAPGILAKKIAAVQVPFIENQGQIENAEVQFYAQTFAGTLFVTKENHLVYSLPQKDPKNAAAVWAFRESFVGRLPTRPQGENKSPARVSYYKGNNPQVWQKQLATFERIALGELYPGIRVSLQAAANNVEKLFYVAPGAAPTAIKMDVDGVQSIYIDDRRQLVLATALGDIVFTAPIAYQLVDGKRQTVDVAYELADGHYGFKVGDYDKNYELVIDPLLASTYIGGHNPSPPGNYDDDIIHGMVVTDDYVYIAGATQSPDFPVELGYDDSLENAYPDGFITQMTSDLSAVLASTYIGTQYFDRVQDIAVDDGGLIVAVGQAGYGFPVTDGAYTWSGTTPVGGGFIAKFSADLSDLVVSAVVTPSDYPLQVTLGNGGIYFGGRTNNPDFPITPGAYRATCCPAGGFGIREYDGFAGKMSPDLTTLQALTYLGGDSVSGLAVAPNPDGKGTVFISDGSDNAITGYLARFDAGLTERQAYLSYYPGSTSGSSRTYFNDVAVGADYVVTAGQTYMDDLPATGGAFDTSCGTDGVCDGVGSLLVPRPDGFVAKYSLDLQDTLALTYLGGSDGESCRSIALDADGNIYVAGETISPDFPTAGNGADTSCGSDGQCNPSGTYGTPAADGFVVKLTADLSQLLYGSYIGGSGEDRPNVIALDDAGLVYAAGYTRSADFPTTAGAFDKTYNGGTSDAFISQFDAVGDGSGGGGPLPNETPIADAGSDQTVGPRQRVYLNGSGSSDADGQIVQYHWTQVGGKAVSIKNANSTVANFTAPGVKRGQTKTLVFELEVTDDLDATAIDQVTIYVTR